MDKAYEELDDAKAEVERLKAELRRKTDSLENLKQFQNAQVNQIREAKLKNEKLGQDLLQKEDEIIEAKQNFEDLKGDLNTKESIIKHLSAANDKLKRDCDEKLKNWEDEKKGLVLALEEAVEKAENQDQKIHVYRQEIESLKGCLAASRRCVEVEKKSEASKELRKSDDILHNLEDENMKVAEQLKWKKEQFKHLEEAHEKVREQFRSSKKEWELEKSSLLDEISSLQMKLDSQIRISENLQNQLKMCSQALAQEESRRKRLEVQVTDYKERFENVISDYKNARFELDQFNSQRDKDIGGMRYSLKTKEAHCKELKYTIQKLEQENKELRASLKELQEAQIQEAGASYSQSKLRSKLKNLENIHRECASTLQAKEAEWKLQIEKLAGKLNEYRSELENKEEATEELKMELENKTEAMEELKRELTNSHSLTFELDLLKEEMSLLLFVLKEEISEAKMKLVNDKEDMDLINKEREEKCFELIRQLEMKNAALIEAQKYNKEELALINKEREEKCSELMNLLENKEEATEELKMELENKTEAMEELKRELTNSHSLTFELDLLKEEMSLLLFVLKEEISEAKMKLVNDKEEMDLINKEREEKCFELIRQLEMKNAALIEAQKYNKEELALINKEREEKCSELMNLLENKEEATEELKMELENKTEAMEELKRELTNSHSLTFELDLLKEEMSLLLFVLKEEISEAKMKLVNDKEEMDLINKEREEKCFELIRQLEMKNAALIEAQKYNKEELALINKEREEKCSELMNLLENKEEATEELKMELENKTEAMEELKRELTNSHSLTFELDLLKEEMSLLLFVLKEEISEAKMKLVNDKEEMDLINKEREEKCFELIRQLEMKNAALIEAQKYNKEELALINKEREEKCSELMNLLENKEEATEELKMELENKTEAMEELKRELTNSHSLTFELDLLKEEMSLLLFVLKEEISEAKMKLVNDKEEMDLINKEREEKCFELIRQLEMKNAALIEAQKYNKEELALINKEREEKCSELMNLLEMKDTALIRAQKEINEEREKVEHVMKDVDSLSITKEQLHSLQNELDRYKEMLDVSTKSQLLLKDKTLQMESDSREKLKEVSDALDRANTELDEKIYEVNEMEYELQIWTSIVERLKNDLEENHMIRKELENSLLVQVDYGETLKQEKDSLIYKLQENEIKLDGLCQQVILLEQELKRRQSQASSPARGQTAVSSETDKFRYLQKEILCLEQESCKGEFEHQKLMHQVASLGNQFSTSCVSFSSQRAEKQAEINLVQDACDRITAAEIIAILETEERKLMIAELEDDIHNLEQKLKLQEERWSQSEQLALEIEAEMGTKQLTLKELTDQIEARLKSSDASYHKLKMENRNLLENVTRLLSERENLLGFVMRLDEKINEFSTTDTQLMDQLGSIGHSFEDDCSGMNFSREDEFLTKENIKMHSPVGTKRLEVVVDVRSPFKELNN